MLRKFLTTTIFLLSSTLLVVFIFSATPASANGFTNVVSSIWNFIFGSSTTPPTEPVIPPTTVVRDTNIPITSSNTVIIPPTSTHSSITLTDQELYDALSKLNKLPDNIIRQLRGPQGLQGPQGPAGTSGSSSSSGITYVSGGVSGSGRSSNSNPNLWHKTAGGTVYNNNNQVAVGTNTLSGNATLQVQAQADTLGSEQTTNGDFASQYGNDEITNGNFSSNADSWDLGDGWTYDADQKNVSFDGLGSEEITNGDFSDMSGWEGGSAWSASGNAAHFTHVGAINESSDLTLINQPGSGYQVNDVLTIDGGDENATIEVTSVDGDGGITGFDITNTGTNYTSYSNGTYGLLNGSGSGAIIFVYSPDALYQTGELIEGDTYEVTFDISGTTGSVEVHLGQGGESTSFGAGAGTESFTGVWHSLDSERIIFFTSGDFDGTITNVSVKHVSTDTLSQSGTLTEGVPYKVTLDVGGTEGSVIVGLDGCDNSTINAGEGVMTFTGNWCEDAGNKLNIIPTPDFNGTIDSVSVKSIVWQSDTGWDISGGTATHTGSQGVAQDDGLDSGGSDYVVGDVLTIDGGNHDATITVTSTDGDPGPILTYDFTTHGTGYGNNCYDLTGGHGSGGVLCVFTDAKTGVLQQPGTLEDGQKYKVSFHITGTAGTVTSYLCDCEEYSFDAGTGDVSFTATYLNNDDNFLTFAPTGDFNGSISNVSVKLATTNAAQTWKDASGNNLLTITSSGSNQSQLNFNIPNSDNYIALRAPASLDDGNIIWTLPDADSAGCLKSNGGGTLYIDTCGSSGGGSIEDENGNIVTGVGAFASNENGGVNIALGDYTLNQNISGNDNLAFGRYALNLNTTGGSNIALGPFSLQSNTNGIVNTAVGRFALYGNVGGGYNTAMGDFAGYQNVSGNNNVFFGRHAGENSLGDDNIFLGAFAGQNETGSNKLFIGAVNENGDTPIIYGDLSTGNVGIGTTNPNSPLTVSSSDTSGIVTLANFQNPEGQTRFAIKYDNSASNVILSLGSYSISQETAGGYIGFSNSIGIPNSGKLLNMADGNNDYIQFRNNQAEPSLLFANHQGTSGKTFRFWDSSTVGSVDSFAVGSGSSYDEKFTILNNGNVGIGNTTPSVALDVTGDIEYTGTITDVSDKRLKENITDYTGALDVISQLQAKSYNMIISPDRPETGFIAQDVQQIFPQAVSIIDPTKGYLGVSYVSLVPVIAEAVKELNLKVDNLVTIPTDGSENSFLTKLIAWLGDAGNGITKLFTKEIHTDQLCVGTVCVTQEQFLNMVNQGGGTATPPPVTPPTPDPVVPPTPDPVPPVPDPSTPPDAIPPDVVTPPDATPPPADPAPVTP